ncbi:MAG: response UmuD protein Serine peptidase family [Rhizobacter sp.]|nr:response UmuD protein Serine peptidase family [Rhizobacter sp.]
MNSPDSIPDGAPVGASGPAPRTRSSGTGFGSPGEDATVRRIDLNEALIRHPEATFVMRASGVAMVDAGIDDGDVLLVDRALTPVHGSVLIAVVEGELVCRRLWQQDGMVRLHAASVGPADVQIDEATPLEVWGVVTTVIKSLV